jgi:hypothetical protein
MRIMGLAVTGMVVALAGALAVCTADPAFAATKKHHHKYQARQNGATVNTPVEGRPSGRPGGPPNEPRAYGERNSGKIVNPDRVIPNSPGGQGGPNR